MLMIASAEPDMSIWEVRNNKQHFVGRIIWVSGLPNADQLSLEKQLLTHV